MTKIKKAMYRRRTVYAGNTVEISETYPTQFGDCLTRERSLTDSKGTPEAMKRYNAELSARRLTRLINANFIPDDLWVTLTYERDNRPSSYDEACKVLSGFIVKLRKLYKEHKFELKYVKGTGYGERGAVHHHIVIPQGVKTKHITQLWKEHIGASREAHPPYYVPLYSDGEYSTLANYIVDQLRPGEEDIKYVKKWIGSRNLTKPYEAPPEDIEEIKWAEPPEPWEGYYIDTNSIKAGTNEITGRPYLFYRMVKTSDGFTCRDDNGRLLKGADAAAYFRENNKEYIRQHWYLINTEGEVIFLDELGERQNE